MDTLETAENQEFLPPGDGAVSASGKPRTLKIIGNGWHPLTKVLDAETGEDIGLQLGVQRIEYRIGDEGAYPRARLILELLCPVIIEIAPEASEITRPEPRVSRSG